LNKQLKVVILQIGGHHSEYFENHYLLGCDGKQFDISALMLRMHISAGGFVGELLPHCTVSEPRQWHCAGQITFALN